MVKTPTVCKIISRYTVYAPGIVCIYGFLLVVLLQILTKFILMEFRFGFTIQMSTSQPWNVVHIVCLVKCHRVNFPSGFFIPILEFCDHLFVFHFNSPYCNFRLSQINFHYINLHISKCIDDIKTLYTIKTYRI